MNGEQAWTCIRSKGETECRNWIKREESILHIVGDSIRNLGSAGLASRQRNQEARSRSPSDWSLFWRRVRTLRTDHVPPNSERTNPVFGTTSGVSWSDDTDEARRAIRAKHSSSSKASGMPRPHRPSIHCSRRWCYNRVELEHTPSAVSSEGNI